MAKPHPPNFEYLDPAAPRTKRVIEAALTVNVPWHPQEPAPQWEPPAMAELAKRIAERARQGKVVHLSAATAWNVAIALYKQAAGNEPLRDTHPHMVEVSRANRARCCPTTRPPRWRSVPGRHTRRNTWIAASLPVGVDGLCATVRETEHDASVEHC
jgi:hypothetical protein